MNEDQQVAAPPQQVPSLADRLASTKAVPSLASRILLRNSEGLARAGAELEANIPKAPEEAVGNQIFLDALMRNPPGRAAAGANIAAVPPQSSGPIEMFKAGLRAIPPAFGAAGPPTYDDIAKAANDPGATPQLKASFAAVNQLMDLSRQNSAIVHGSPQASPDDYRKAMNKLIVMQTKEIEKENAATPGPTKYDELKGRTQEQAEADDALSAQLGIAPSGQGAYTDEAAKFGAIQQDAIKRAQAIAIPGIHRAPISKDEAAALMLQLSQAKSAGDIAQFRSDHPWAYTALDEAGSMAPFLAAGQVIGPLARAGAAAVGLGAGVAGAAEMATLDTADQILRIKSGTQPGYDPVRAIMSVGTFAAASKIGEGVAERYYASKATGPLAAAEPEIAQQALAAQAKKAIGDLPPQAVELLKRLEAARQAATLVGAVTNQASFSALTSAQKLLEQGKDGDLGGTAMEQVIRGSVDALMALGASNAFPVEVTRAKALETAHQIQGLQDIVLENGGKEVPPAPPGAEPAETVADQVNALRDKRGTEPVPPEPKQPRQPIVPSDSPLPLEQVKAQVTEDMGKAASDQDRATIASPEVIAKYADAAQLSGEDRVKLREHAEDLARRTSERVEDRSTAPEERLGTNEPAQQAPHPAPRLADRLRAAGVTKVEAIPDPNGPRLMISDDQVAAMKATLGAARARAISVGDQEMVAKLDQAHELTDRMVRNGVASTTSQEIQDLARTASDLDYAAAKAPLTRQARREYGQAASELANRLSDALLGRAQAIAKQQKFVASGQAAVTAAMRAASAMEVGSEVHVLDPNGIPHFLEPDERRDLIRQLRSGQMGAELQAKTEGKAIEVRLSDGSTARITKTPGGADEAKWDTLKAAYEKQTKQAGNLLFGSDPAAAAVGRAMESQTIHDAHEVFDQQVVEPVLEAAANFGGKASPALKQVLKQMFGLGKVGAIDVGREMGRKLFGPDILAIENAKADLNRFLKRFPGMEGEILSVLSQLQQRGKFESKFSVSQGVIKEGMQHVQRIMQIADRIGTKLYELGRLPRAVFAAVGPDGKKIPDQKRIVIMKGDPDEGKPPPPGYVLDGGVDYYREKGYLTHNARALMDEFADPTSAFRGAAKVPGLAGVLKSLLPNFRGRQLQGEEAYQAGSRADIPLTIDTLLREGFGGIEAVTMKHLADTGIILKNNPNDLGTEFGRAHAESLAEVEGIKTILKDKVKRATDALRMRLDEAAAETDQGKRSKALADATVLRQAVIAHTADLRDADQQASPFVQLNGRQYGPYDGWWIRGDALASLKARASQGAPLFKLWAALTSWRRANRNQYEPRSVASNYVSNLTFKNEVLGTPFWKGSVRDGKAVYNFVFNGEPPRGPDGEVEPVFAQLLAQGRFKGIGGRTENYTDSNADRAMQAADRYMASGEYGNALISQFEAIVHKARGLPEKVPYAGAALGALRKAVGVADMATYYGTVRQLVAGESVLGKPMSVDEAIVRADRYFNFAQLHPATRLMMQLGFNLAGYSSKIGEALLGPPVKPRYLGFPIPGTEWLASQARDPTSVKGKAAYAAYKATAVAGAIFSHLAPFMALGWGMRKLYGYSEDEVERARQDQLHFEGKGWLGSQLMKYLLLPGARKPDGHIGLVDLRPLSWLGAVVDFGSGWLGNRGQGWTTGLWGKTIFGSALRSAYDPTANEDDLKDLRTSIKLPLQLAPGIAADVVDEALRKWDDAGRGKVIDWPESITRILAGIHILSGDSSQNTKTYNEMTDQGRYMQKLETKTRDPMDFEAEVVRQLRAREFQATDASINYKLNNPPRLVDRLKLMKKGH